MKVSSTIRLAAAAAAILAFCAAPALADIVYLTSGATLSVRSHHEDGASMVLALRDGGQVTCDKSLIERIAPDEVPHPDPAPQAPKPASDQAPPVDAAAILQSTPYGDFIAAAAEAHGVDPLLVRALIQVESNYKPRARSSKGAMGLMQLMPETARQYRVRNPFDPKTNIDAGVRQLKTLIDKWGTELGLAAYNAGEGVVAKFGGIPPYRETRTYVSRILALYRGQ
jgi:membrane-bound lytic murein transglycosylase B